MIKETVNEYRFSQTLRNDEYASWSYGATKALFDYYEQLSEAIGEDIEFDPVAIRCEWAEYQNALDAFIQHHGEYGDDIPQDEGIRNEEQAREWLEDNTTVLDVENVDTNATEYRTIKSILVMQF